MWEIIAREMKIELAKHGHERFPTYKQCNNRWTTMNKAYRATIDHNRKSGADRRTCYYFQELDEINHERPNVNPVAIVSSFRPGQNKSAAAANEKNDSDDESDGHDHEEIDSEDSEETLQASSSKTATKKMTNPTTSKPKRKRKYTSAITQNTSAILCLKTYE